MVTTGVAASTPCAGSGTTGRRSPAGGGNVGAPGGSTNGGTLLAEACGASAASAVVGRGSSESRPGNVTSFEPSGVAPFAGALPTSASSASGPFGWLNDGRRMSATPAKTSAAAPSDASRSVPSRPEPSPSFSWMSSR